MKKGLSCCRNLYIGVGVLCFWH